MRTHRPRPALAIIALGVALLVGACSDASPSNVVPNDSAAAAQPTIEAPDPGTVYDPVRAGESLPPGYRQLLDRDQIAPVYNPAFTTPEGVDWPEDSLVIGISGAETAKAYPITHLNQREMVIDSLEGIPVLVTW